MRTSTSAAVAVLGLLCVSSVLARISFCGSEVGRCLHAEVNNCDSDAPHCVLRRGTKAAIKISFSPDHEVPVVKPQVFGVLNGFPIPFPLSQTNACGTCGFECPLEAGHHYNYSDAVAVRRMYPPMYVVMKNIPSSEATEHGVVIPSPEKKDVMNLMLSLTMNSTRDKVPHEVAVTVLWKLLDEKDKVICCVKIPSVIR